MTDTSPRRHYGESSQWFSYIAGLVPALLVAACSDYGVEDEPGARAQDLVGSAPMAQLPEPSPSLADPAPVLEGDQAARREEVNRFIAERYARLEYRILATTQGPSGDVIDWMAAESVPGSEEQPPADDQDTLDPEGNALAKGPPLTDFDTFTELQGPPGSVPFVRPGFDGYVEGNTDAVTVEDFIAKAPTGQPAGQFRLYGGYRFDDELLTRAISDIQQFAGSVSTNTFNILEMTAGCGTVASTREFIGVVVGRGAAGDFGTTGTTLRLQAEYFTDGTDDIGNNTGGWVGLVTGFVPAAGAPYGPGVTLTGISDVGGPAAWWSPVELRLSGGNWHLWHNGNRLGHFPGSFFNLMGSNACRATWYGEVYDGSPTSWTSTNMGSGQFAAAGGLFASYHSSTFYVDTSGTSKWPDASGVPGATGFDPVGPVDTACYTTGTPGTSGTRFFYLGGPGGDAAGCN